MSERIKALWIEQVKPNFGNAFYKLLIRKEDEMFSSDPLKEEDLMDLKFAIEKTLLKMQAKKLEHWAYETFKKS